MYKLVKSTLPNISANTVERLSDNAFIPFDSANNDYQQFKKDIESGVELQDSEGNPMSQEAAIEFVRGLP